MKSYDSIIGRRVVYHYHDIDEGLSNNNVYRVLDEFRSRIWTTCIDKILILNDYGIEEWYEIGLGIDKFWLLSNEYVRYIGSENSWTNEGKLIYGAKYELIDRYSDEYIYFIDSKGDFIGPRRINYIGGEVMFESVPIEELRDDKISKIIE